jgi:purine-binding chemotaxis protein CheW
MQSTGQGENGQALAATEPGGTSGEMETWVVFLVDEQKYALKMEEVERIIRAVEVKPLPQSPPHILGIVNMHGRIVPVVDLRLLLRRPRRDLRLEDHFVVARTPTLAAILPVDAALGSLEVIDTSVETSEGGRDRYIRKIVPVRNEVIYTLDLERLVFADQSPTDSDFASVMSELQVP